MPRYHFASVTRISDLAARSFEARALPRSAWATGDYVVGEVAEVRGTLHNIELPSGRMMEVMPGDLVVGALGARAATLEAVGDWRAQKGETFHALTPAGLFGELTSISPFLPPVMRLAYRGHAVREEAKVTMSGSVETAAPSSLDVPVIMIVGTSMSAGKTLSGRVMVHLLSQAGKRVVGAKLTGAARYRDVLSFADAGAEQVFDFVDAGLPSTVCPPDTYRQALEVLLAKIAGARPDVVVAEAGASPLEPYNGDTAVHVLGERIRFMLLCAQDPYAVLGVREAFDRVPDAVAGGAANTTAAIELVRRLTGLKALNLMTPAAHGELETMLERAIAD